MSGPKDTQFSQFARVSASGVIAAPKPDDDGIVLLADENGRLWVRAALGGPSSDVPFTGAGQDYVHDLQKVVEPPLSQQQYALDRSTLRNADTLTAKVKPGRLYYGFAAIDSQQAAYLQVHNTIGTPGIGRVPELTVGARENPEGGNERWMQLDLSTLGLYCSVGITLAFSVAPGEYDPPTANDSLICILFR